MSYARARLWLGISSVGTLTLAVFIALMAGLPRRFPSEQSLLNDLGGLSLVLLAYLLISAPFDWLGGFFLPRHHGRPHPPAGSFLRGWLTGIASHALVMLLCGVVLLQLSRRFGEAGGILGFAALSLGLLVFQFPLARLVGGLGYRRWGKDLPEAPGTRADGRGIVLAGARDEGFVGGLVGLPGRELLVLPEAWLRALRPDELSIQLARRQAAVATGSRLRGVLLALAWNLAGFTLSARLTESDTASLSGLVTTSLGFTLWSFLGLLLLPTPSRSGVFEVDQAMRAQDFSPAAVESLLRTLDARQDGESVRPAGVETIFHPVPALLSRLESLPTRAPGIGCWHAARMALPLSWAGLGFLSRAVHCNCGRPELWVLLPGD